MFQTLDPSTGKQLGDYYYIASATDYTYNVWDKINHTRAKGISLHHSRLIIVKPSTFSTRSDDMTYEDDGLYYHPDLNVNIKFYGPKMLLYYEDDFRKFHNYLVRIVFELNKCFEVYPGKTDPYVTLLDSVLRRGLTLVDKNGIEHVKSSWFLIGKPFIKRFYTLSKYE